MTGISLGAMSINIHEHSDFDERIYGRCRFSVVGNHKLIQKLECHVLHQPCLGSFSLKHYFYEIMSYIIANVNCAED